MSAAETPRVKPSQVWQEKRPDGSRGLYAAVSRVRNGKADLSYWSGTVRDVPLEDVVSRYELIIDDEIGLDRSLATAERAFPTAVEAVDRPALDMPPSTAAPAATPGKVLRRST